MSQPKDSNSPDQKKPTNDMEAIKLVYIRAGGWSKPRSPMPHLLEQAGVPESVWFTTYDAAVRQRAAFLSTEFKNWFTFSADHLKAWVKVVHEQQVIYAFYGIKVLFLRSLPTPGLIILGGLMFESTPHARATIQQHELKSFVKELEVLYGLYQSGGLTDDEYALSKERVIHSNGIGESVAVAVTDVVPASVHCDQASIIVSQEEETQELTTGSIENEKANLV